MPDGKLEPVKNGSPAPKQNEKPNNTRERIEHDWYDVLPDKNEKEPGHNK